MFKGGLEAHSTANTYFWAHTVVSIFHCHWNDFRYPKILVYINSIRFIDDLRMLKNLVLCRRVVWRCSKIPIIFAGKNNRSLMNACSVGGIVLPAWAAILLVFFSSTLLVTFKRYTSPNSSSLELVGFSCSVVIYKLSKSHNATR